MYKKPIKPSLFLKIIERFLTLPFGRKVLFSFSCIGFISLFFPWFYEGLKMFNALEKFSIIGVMLFIISFLVLFISIRETFFFKKYFLGLPHYYAYLLLLLTGIYTLILQTSALYEILNYNPRAYISFGGTVLFFSYGLSLVGLLISKTFVPVTPKVVKEKKPEDINISHVSLDAE